MSDAVERLREIAKRTVHWGTIAGDDARAILAHIANLEAQRDAAHAAGVAEERARVVAWLRAGIDKYPHGTYARCQELQSYWAGAADAIEAGQHERTDDVA